MPQKTRAAARATAAATLPISPTPVSPTATNDGEDYFTQLPNELLILIAASLDLKERLKFRLLFPKKDQAVMKTLLEPFSGRLSRLYVSPTRASLDCYSGVCGSPFWREYVNEVVFVARALDVTFSPDSTDAYRQSIESLAATSQYYHDTLRRESARAMVALMRADTDNVMLERSLELHEAFVESHVTCVKIDGWKIFRAEHAVVISQLAQGLSMLPHLASAGIATEITGDGLNMSPLWYSEDFATQKVIRAPHSRSIDLLARAAEAVYRGKLAIAGQDAFVEALQVSGVRPRSCKLGNLVSVRRWEVDYSDARILPATAAATIAPNVTRLEVGCAAMGFLTPLQEKRNPLYKSWKAFAQNLSSLQELTVNVGVHRTRGWLSRRFARRYERGAHILSTFTGAPAFPQLRRLAIIGDVRCAGIVQASELIDFLREHHGSLQECRLEHILCNEDAPAIGAANSVPAAIESLLVVVRDVLRLENFSMSIQRKNEDCVAVCGRNRHRPAAPLCTSYSVGKEWSDRSHLENLAARLGVTLKGEVWDFGDFVKRTGTVEKDQ